MVNRRWCSWPRVLGIVIVSGAWWLLWGAAAAAQPVPGNPAGPGAEVCKACHAPYYETYLTHPHSAKGDRRSPANAGECAACHGDGTAHVKAGGGRGVGGIINPGAKSPLSAEAKSNICLTCHQAGPRMSWQGSPHPSADVACTNCHTVHAARDEVRVKITQSDVCFACHTEQRAQINRPSRHPIREGQVVCADCHNPHGGAGPNNLVKATLNEVCYTCHAEKRGPFLREHPPARESCANCHTPHGSLHTPLLRARVPWLCQECHSAQMHPSTAYSGTGVPPRGAAQQILARGCENCHAQVHGTNHPSGWRLTR
jgi:DmsE family decaheme c-type cytochrome